jgi:hypothetical protein
MKISDEDLGATPVKSNKKEKDIKLAEESKLEYSIDLMKKFTEDFTSDGKVTDSTEVKEKEI